MTSDETRARLIDMPDYGRVVEFPGRPGPVIDFSPDLKGRRRYLWAFYGKKFTSREEAETVRTGINSAAKNMSLGEAVDQFRSPRSQKDTVWETCERFLDVAPSIGSQRTGKNYTPRTIYHYERVLTRARPYFDEMSMRDFFQPDSLAGFRSWFRLPKEEGGRGLGSETEMANAMIALRAVVRWYQTKNPNFDVRWPSMPGKLTIAKRDRKRQRTRENRRGRLKLRLGEVVRIIALIPEEKQPIYWCLFFTQCRITEARAVLGCDYENGRIYIERSAAGAGPKSKILDETKNDIDGGYLLPEFVQAIINEHCTHARFDEKAPLFRNPHPQATGHMWAEGAITEVWKSATKRAGQPYVPTYVAMKNTQVSALREAGISIDDIVEQCRWASSQMMAHYDDARDERRDAVVIKLGELAADALGSPEKSASPVESQTEE